MDVFELVELRARSSVAPALVTPSSAQTPRRDGPRVAETICGNALSIPQSLIEQLKPIHAGCGTATSGLGVAVDGFDELR